MVLVTGAALTPFNRRKDNSSFRDWAEAAFGDALAMAEIEKNDIDALIVASESDFFSLQLNPATILAQDLGLVGAEAVRVEGGGASGQLAVHAGVDRLMSGRARHVAVLGVDPSASYLSGDDMRTLYSNSFDFWTDGMTGVTATALYAISWQAFASGNEKSDAVLRAVTLKNRGNAMLNPNAHLPRQHTDKDFEADPIIAAPYRRLHCSPLSDGAAALILSAPDAAPASRKSQATRVTGIGSATDQPGLGHRKDPGMFHAKSKAANKALDMAGIESSAIDVVELYDSYAGAEVQAISALQLSEDPFTDVLEGRFDRYGTLPTNISGGLMGQGAPVGATGVGQVATCALLLEGRYHEGLQPTRSLGHALADTHGGIATLCGVTVLSAGATI